MKLCKSYKKIYFILKPYLQDKMVIIQICGMHDNTGTESEDSQIGEMRDA